MALLSLQEENPSPRTHRKYPYPHRDFEMCSSDFPRYFLYGILKWSASSKVIVEGISKSNIAVFWFWGLLLLGTYIFSTTAFFSLVKEVTFCFHLYDNAFDWQKILYGMYNIKSVVEIF
jgi:hypothetical protein